MNWNGHIGMFVLLEAKPETEMTMKMLAVIALATAIASPAMAQAPQARDQYPAIEPPAEKFGPPIVREPAPDEAFAQAPRNQRRTANPAWDVYVGGKFVGSDPDPLVRDQMRREAENPTGS